MGAASDWEASMYDTIALCCIFSPASLSNRKLDLSPGGKLRCYYARHTKSCSDTGVRDCLAPGLARCGRSTANPAQNPTVQCPCPSKAIAKPQFALLLDCEDPGTLNTLYRLCAHRKHYHKYTLAKAIWGSNFFVAIFGVKWKLSAHYIAKSSFSASPYH